MISIIKSLFEEYFSIPSFNVVILGPQQTGKTRFFNIIKTINTTDSVPHSQSLYTATVGLNTTKLKTNHIRLCIWDLGGKKSIRKIWENYFPETHAIVYFVRDDAQDSFDESVQLLRQVLRHNEMARIPVLLLIKNNSSHEKLTRFIEKEPQIFNRQFNIQVFEFEQVGVLSDPNAAIKRQQVRILQLLKWLYVKCMALDKEVKSYGLVE